ncbi:DEAD/DEAH box helicase [Mycolicibacterium sp. YH-1]|uniref:DEAD/DEAH box helicase n=1 Tax=Mycolicibacterium sp. YH-1 TaxID=2908837 RepID=UPI001F4C36F5|nr:DEAD/DEAH box helicase [Mycolicibacterium sp. YH-1]UNB55482.1 Helicase associated domain protein [Mycolicibacterium sp. YH-1]
MTSAATPNLISVTQLGDLLARLDADPYRRGKQFEHICKWFLTHDPVYAHELRQVWLWDEWPARWGIDAGIDLVAEDRNGHLWAIQAKAYDPACRITKRDVNKFLAESGRALFTYRMLIATTNLIDRIGERTIQDQEKRVTFFRLNDLQAADVDWPASPMALRTARPRKPARPHDYQREAIKKVVKRFESADRGQLIMACGTGKTLTAQFIREKLAADRTLVLVPSLSLLKQTLNVWRANSATEFASLPVCSDDTVARDDDDVAVSHTSDLGVPVTTDPVEIAAFLRQRSGPRVVFATYQSSPQIAEAFLLSRVPAFDLVIADEAHRCAGPVSSDFATILDPQVIKARRRLFMTATPRYFTGRVVREAEEAEFEVASMDNEAAFGPVFHRLGFAEAIELKRLTDYQVAVVGVDDATYRDWAERGRFVTMDGTEVTDARTLAGQIGLAKAMRKYDLRRTISFHSRVKRAREFAVSIPEVIAWMPARQRPKGALWATHASGEMPAGDRYVLLQHLARLDESERGLLTNARCLAEGVDVPTLDGVAFIDPRRSEVDIVQAVGRAIRLAPDKTVGTIVIPVFIDTNEDPETALDGSAFKPVWDVIKALRSHDDELGKQLDELRRQVGRLGQRGRPRIPPKIHFDLPARVGADFARAFDARLVEQTTASWEFWYGLLERYVGENGTAWVRGTEMYEGYRLGQWVLVQRTKWKTLPEDRKVRLLAIPGWITDVREFQWEEGFSHLVQYVAQEGDAHVHDEWVAEDGYRLGKWVGKQRSKWDKLTDGQRKRLSELPGWTQDAITARWETGYRLLQQYAAETGDANPPQDYVVEGFNLGIWVRTQRARWEFLSEERQELLRQIDGWMVDLLGEKWDRTCRMLEKYADENGTSAAKQTLLIDGVPVGRWVSKQRDRWDLLTDEQRARLKKLPGWTLDARGVWWEEAYQRLHEYVGQHGSVPRGKLVYKGFRLGAWIINQKSRWDTLTPERQQRLSMLAGWTLEAHQDRWEDGIQRLEDYAKANGTARLPNRKYIHNGFKLGGWADRQRDNWENLSEDRRSRLDALPGWVPNVKQAQWDEGYEYLLKYIEQNGDAAVPTGTVFDGYKLGQWVTVQRTMFRRGAIKPERRATLGRLPGWVWKAR